MSGVVIVTSSFPADIHDTAGVFLRPLVRMLARERPVRVITPAVPGAAERRLDGVPVTRVRYAPRRHQRLFNHDGALVDAAALGRFMTAVLAMNATTGMAAACRGGDIAVAQWLYPAGVACALAGVPFGVVAHGSDVTMAERHPALAHLARIVARRARAVAAVSPGLAERLARVTGSEVEVLPIPVDEPVPAQASRWRHHDVAFMGRLVPGKGVETLLAAASAAGASVLAAGAGPLEGVVAGARGVTWAGRVAPLQRGEVLRAVDALVVPSVVPEGRPAVALEAAAHGVGLLGSDVAGVRDLVEADARFPAGDAEALARLLVRLRTDAGYRSGIRARAGLLAAAHHADALAPTWRRFLDRVAGASPGGAGVVSGGTTHGARPRGTTAP